MRILKLFGRILSYCLTGLLALLLIYNLIHIGVRIFTGEKNGTILGYTSAVVVTGSMEPNISVNDLVIIHKEDEYAVRDVITYVSQNNNLVTHRIIEITEEGFVTQGDANNTIDIESPIRLENVVGKVVFTIPAVGAAIDMIQTPLGMMCLVLVCFVLLVWPMYVPDRKETIKQEG